VHIKRLYQHLFFILAVFGFQQALQAQKAKLAPLYLDKGKIMYAPDSMGNRIPDFSY